MPNTPPHLADRLLSWFCAPHLREEVLGDLHERYTLRVAQIGESRARRRYWLDVLAYMRPEFIRRQPEQYPQPTNTTMLRNYLKIAWRNLIREKGYASLNMAGLAVGMAASTLIFLWIQSELTYDRFYSKTDRIFQVYNQDIFSGNPAVWGTTPLPLAPTLKQNYPDVEEAIRYRPTTLLLTANDKKMNVEGAFADPSFLNVFDFALLAGNREKVLTGSNGIVITKSLAEKLFGSSDAIGKTLQLDHTDSFLVTGVLHDLPNNTQFNNISFLLPWTAFAVPGWDSDGWGSNNNYTFVLLKDKINSATANEKIKHVTAEHLKGVVEDVSHRQIFLHPATKWHLYSKQENGQLVDGKIGTVHLFSLIAALILLVAAVNFINLTTARSEKRAKEVGIRKVVGAQKRSLVFQFISESLLLAFFAGLLALLVVLAFIPTFNSLTNKQLSLELGTINFWLVASTFVLFTGLLAGSYPAFFLASFQPGMVVKGAHQSINTVFSLRKGLVITQFTFAIVLIIGTLVINDQIHYAQNRDNGYDQNNLLFMSMTGDMSTHYWSFQQELIHDGAAVSVSKSLGPITNLNSRQWGLSWPGSTKADKDIEFDRFAADELFLKTTGTKLLVGRDINVHEYPTDSTAVLLNETAVKTMHLKNPLGTSIRFDSHDWHVVGVVKDFIFASPYEPINPVVVHGPAGSIPLEWMSIRLNPANSTAKNLEITEQITKKYNPNYPFEYTFADESYKAKFADEQRTGSLISLFTGLTIIISCLGLFGLAAYTAQQRTKEIGVRKVLGATVTNIVGLLTKEFIQLIGIAFVIGAPIGWYVMEKWLQDYSYRIAIGVGVFLLTLSSAIVIVTLTVSFQAIKAALVNPVKSLRSE
ncbi:ABC transporter permease [Spirosoma sp. KNUC1025]|uniref:ABC transporter permease n=1 Tax=Spirosoma sp. KNUC1025 TaxID=2894082 RepID=UPI00386352A0|nr:ABC transporter permease [Spirosoma sp. KNUC1025]